MTFITKNNLNKEKNFTACYYYIDDKWNFFVTITLLKNNFIFSNFDKKITFSKNGDKFILSLFIFYQKNICHNI